MSTRILRVETGSKAGPTVPFATAVAGPPVADLFGAAPWTVVSTFSATTTPTFPNLASGASSQQSVTLPLSTFPPTISLRPTDTALIVAGLSIGFSTPTLLLGLPYLALIFGAGSMLSSPGQGASVFTLQPGGTYSAPSLALTLTALYLATAVNPIPLPISVWALLLGQTAR